MNVGPESRSQTRSVFALKNCTRSRSTPARSSRSATLRFIVPPATTMHTVSTRLSWRTISV